MISLKPVEDMVKQKGAQRRSVFVVDEQGRLVTHSDPETLYKGVDLSTTAIVKSFQDSRGLASGSVNFELVRDSEPMQMLGTYTPIGDRASSVPFLRTLGWGAIVQAEQDAVFFSARQIVRNSLLIAILSAGLAVVLAVVFAGRLSQPIAELAEGARRLASGDFSQNIEVKSGNEIGEFAETFNFMIEEIRRFIERFRKAAEENKQMFMGAVTSLAAAIDAKDPYTAGHSERVAHYSATIANILKFPEEQVETIRISALMHDVGKIGIQDNILGKAGPLTDKEFEIMKTHPTKGADIMQHVPQLSAMIPGIKFHHENVDGDRLSRWAQGRRDSTHRESGECRGHLRRHDDQPAVSEGNGDHLRLHPNAKLHRKEVREASRRGSHHGLRGRSDSAEHEGAERPEVVRSRTTTTACSIRRASGTRALDEAPGRGRSLAATSNAVASPHPIITSSRRGSGGRTTAFARKRVELDLKQAH